MNKVTILMDQNLINWLLGIFSGIFSMLIGFLLNMIWNAVKDLQKSDASITNRIAAVETLVAGDYLKRKEFDDSMRERNREFQDSIRVVFSKLDTITEKIDRKADKS